MKAKKAIYLILTSFLGLIMSFIVHAGIELLYLRYVDEITWYTYFGGASCSLHPVISFLLAAAGIIGGFFLGHLWWNIVYVEDRHWRFRKKDSQ